MILWLRSPKFQIKFSTLLSFLIPFDTYLLLSCFSSYACISLVPSDAIIYDTIRRENVPFGTHGFCIEEHRYQSDADLQSWK